MAQARSIAGIGLTGARGQLELLLWSLLLGSVSIHFDGKTPGVLYFDVLLGFWLVYQVAYKRFWPDFRGWIVSLGGFCLLVGMLSTIFHYQDIYKSLGALKILGTGLLVYTIARKVPPRILMLSAWGGVVGILLLVDFQQLRFGEYEGIAGMKDFVAISLGHSNTIASILLLVFPLPAAGLAIFKGWKRLFSLICVLLMSAGLAVTMSRGALVALVLAVLISAPLLWRVGFKWKQWLASFAILGILLFALPADLLETNAALIAYRWENPDLNRAELMETSWRIFTDNPMLGVGPGQIGNALSHRITVPDEYTPYMNGHNLVLDALAQNGLFAGIAMLTMVGFVLWAAWRALKREANPVAVALWVAILSAVLHNMVEPSFESQYFQIVFWSVAAMVETQHRWIPSMSRLNLGASLPAPQPTEAL